MWAWHILSEKRGGVAILVGVSLMALCGFAAFAIDWGYYLVVKNELQNAADAAALAGARELGRILYDASASANYELTPNERNAIRDVVNNVAQRNNAAGQPVTILPNDEDIQPGWWDCTAERFSPGPPYNGVKVIARRDDVANGPIGTFFARVWGQNTLSLSVPAIAVRLLDLAVWGAERDWFNEHCTDPTNPEHNITFSPNPERDETGKRCTAWHTFDESPPNADTIKDILEGMLDGTFPVCSTWGGGLLEYTNANFGDEVWDLLQKLFNAIIQTKGEWKVSVPLYDDEDYPSKGKCQPQTKSRPIVEVGKVTITNVQPQPNFKIMGKVECGSSSQFYSSKLVE